MEKISVKEEAIMFANCDDEVMYIDSFGEDKFGWGVDAEFYYDEWNKCNKLTIQGVDETNDDFKVTFIVVDWDDDDYVFAFEEAYDKWLDYNNNRAMTQEDYELKKGLVYIDCEGNYHRRNCL